MRTVGPLRTLIVVIVAFVFVWLVDVLLGDRRLHSGVVARLRQQLTKWPVRRFNALIASVEAADRVLGDCWGAEP